MDQQYSFLPGRAASSEKSRAAKQRAGAKGGESTAKKRAQGDLKLHPEGHQGTTASEHSRRAKQRAASSKGGRS
jgi:hypothetical protein